MRVSIFLIVSLSACGRAGTGRYGIIIDDDTHSIGVEQVDDAVDAVLQVIGGAGRQLDGVELSIERNALPVDGAAGACRYQPVVDGKPSGLCATGLTYLDYNRIRVWKHTDCWARTAFVHELCHEFQWWRDGAIDMHHTSPKWWMGASPSGSTTSVEGRAQTIAIHAECPDSP